MFTVCASFDDAFKANNYHNFMKNSQIPNAWWRWWFTHIIMSVRQYCEMTHSVPGKNNSTTDIQWSHKFALLCRHTIALCQQYLNTIDMTSFSTCVSVTLAHCVVLFPIKLCNEIINWLWYLSPLCCVI